MMQLRELGEFGLIERIRCAADQTASLVGIGDDCAAFQLPADTIPLVSTDMLLEDIHFKPAWTDYYSIGCKAVAVNVSDVAAMGGTPQAIFLGLAAPAEMPVEHLEELLRGVREEARRYGAELMGGDTCRSTSGLVLSITVHGYVAEKQLVKRSGAQPGDMVWVSGCLGESGLALKHLQQQQPPEKAFALRHHRPQARVALGRELAEQGLAKAMIDVSDGLLADLGHIMRACGAGAEVDLQKLPLSSEMQRHIQQNPEDLALAWQGGEDYELLFCAAVEKAATLEKLSVRLSIPLTAIGVLREEAGLSLIGMHEKEGLPGRLGFDHFTTP